MMKINFEKKKKNEIINKRAAGIAKCKICCNCKEKFENKYLRDKKYSKVRDHCHYTGGYRGAAHRIWNLKYSVPKTFPIVFHNGFYSDWHFIIKELAEKSKQQFSC